MGKIGWPTGQRARRMVWLGGVSVAVAAVIALGLIIFRPAPHSAATAPARTPHPSAGHASPVRSASNTAASWRVASPIADLSEPLPGMPPVPNPANIYADAGANMLSP